MGKEEKCHKKRCKKEGDSCGTSIPPCRQVLHNLGHNRIISYNILWIPLESVLKLRYCVQVAKMVT